MIKFLLNLFSKKKKMEKQQQEFESKMKFYPPLTAYKGGKGNVKSKTS